MGKSLEIIKPVKRFIHKFFIHSRRRIFKLKKNFKKYFQCLEDDVQTKGIYYTIVDEIYKNTHLKNLIKPFVDFLKPDFVISFRQKIFIDKKDNMLSERLLRYKTWEKYETTIFAKNISGGNIVLDIGAHIGYYALIAAKLVGKSGKVYAFEPDSENFGLLKKNISENGYKNVVCEKLAISDKNGRLKLYLSDTNTTDHSIIPLIELVAGLTAKSITLDNYFKGNLHIDFIKIDIQGAEFKALQGAQKILNYNKDIKIITEFWPKALNASGISCKRYLAFLIHQGFKFYNINKYKNAFTRITAEKLLKLYPDGSTDFTNILCRRK